MFRCLRCASLAAGFALAATAGAAEPRSAIPWLTESLAATAPPSPALPRAGEGAIEVSALPPPPLDGVGVLESRVTGLPADLWGGTSALRAAGLIRRLEARGVPAQQALFRTLLLAETAPPPGAGSAAELLLARIDRLIGMGAVEEAQELAQRSGLLAPAVLQRRFDLALLTGGGERGCALLLGTEGVEPTAPARIFCLARIGAWGEAAVALAVARADGALDPAMDALLARFLELRPTVPGDLVEVPAPVTPLVSVLLEAIGAGAAAVADTDLPLAFLHLDLDATAPLRARMLAAERLVAAGGLGFPILFHAYRSGRPAASGGVWDRAAAVQALDAALAAGKGIDATLEAADLALGEIGLRAALAAEYAPELAALPPGATEAPERLAALLLLGGERAAARRLVGETAPARLRAAMAAADPGWSAGPPAAGRVEAAVAAAFAGPEPDLPRLAELRRGLAAGRTGEAILGALALLDAGTEIDAGDLTAALRLLVQAGQEEAARRIAVETLLLLEDG